MVFNRFYILELTNGNLNATWGVKFATPDAAKAPIVLIAKSVLSKDQLASLIDSVAADVHDGEGGYVKPGLSLTVHANVSAADLRDSLERLAKDVRQGHGF